MSILSNTPNLTTEDNAYEVIEKIGEGGFALVYLAKDIQLHRQVVLKVSKSIEAGKNLHIIEGRHLATLDHPSIVKIFGMSKLDGHSAIVMEYVDGRTLNNALQDSISFNEKLQLATQIAETIDYIHAQDLIHGDISPSNFMVDKNGKIRLLDFGLSKSTDELSTQPDIGAPIAGSLAYMAPEVIMGAPVSKQADIYALGILLYFLLFKRLPFQAQAHVSLYKEILYATNESWTFPDGCHPKLRMLIQSMTQRDIKLRLQSVSELVQELRNIAEPPAQVVTPNAPKSQVQSRGSSKKIVLIFGVVALFILVGFFALQTESNKKWGALLKQENSRDLFKDGVQALDKFDQDGQIDLAIDKFKRLSTTRPSYQSAEAWLALSYCLKYVNDGHDEGLLTLAKAAAEHAISQERNLAISHVASGCVLELSGKSALAKSAFEQAYALDPQNIYAINGVARLYMASGKLDQALNFVQTELSKSPQSRLLIELLGEIYFRKGEFALAESEFRKSIALHPDSIFAYANLNATLIKLGRVDEALNVLQQGLQIRPAGRLYTNLGNALFEKQDYPGAEKAFLSALESGKGSPNYFLRWANLGDVQRLLPNRVDDAKLAYRRASQLIAIKLEKTPDNLQLLSRAALYAARADEFELAQKHIATMLNQKITEGSIFFRIAVALEIMGQREQALLHLKNALSNKFSKSMIEVEPDLIQLRRDQKYQHLIMVPTQ